MRVGILAIEAEGYPSMPPHTQVDVTLRLRWAHGNIEDEELLAILVAHPQFCFVGRHTDPVRAMFNFLTALRIGGEQAAADLSGLEVDNINSNVLTQADKSPTVLAINTKREHAGFADRRDLLHRVTILGTELRQLGLRAKINELAIEAGDTVVRLLADLDLIDLLAVTGIDNDEPAILGPEPPSGGHVETFPVRCDARAVAAHLESRFPYDFLRLGIEATERALMGRVVKLSRGRATGEPAQRLLENGHVDALDKLVFVIDIENENASARATLLLSTIRRGHVEVALEGELFVSSSGYPNKQRHQDREDHDFHSPL